MIRAYLTIEPSPPYELGAEFRAVAIFQTEATAPVDPTTVVFKFLPLLSDSEAIITKTYGVDAAVIKDGPGHYHIVTHIDVIGAWVVRALGISTSDVAADELVMQVLPSSLAPIGSHA